MVLELKQDKNKVMKKAYIILLIAIILSCITFFYKKKGKVIQDTKTVNIIGYVTDAVDSSKVKFCSFLDSNPENYYFMLDSTVIENQSFNKSFAINGTGIITIAPNTNIPKIYVICDKEGDIELNVKKDKEKGFIVGFNGKNAKGQQLFYDSKLFKGFLLNEIINENIIKKAVSVNQIIKNIERLKDSLFQPFNRFLEKKEITDSFYKIIKAQAEAKIIGAVESAVAYNLKKEKTNLLSDSQLKEVLKIVFSKYDPFSKKYKNIDLVSRTENAKAKCRLIKQGVLHGTKIDLGLWHKFKSENSYAPIEIQEKMKAIEIMFNQFFKQNEFDAEKKDYELFKKIFPNSIYVEPLSKYFVKNERPIKKATFTFASYEKLNKEIQIIKEYDKNNLDIIVKHEFRNKPILVDLWATWCSPCIKEFSYSYKLHEFLKENDIELLYVSIDKPNAEQKWKKGIIEYNLEGYHLLATNTIIPNLESILTANTEITIPRYLFFDKNGILLDGNLPRPSSGEKLFKRIEELMLK